MSRLKVESEVYNDVQVKTLRTLNNSNALLTVRFRHVSGDEVKADDDGDLVLPRKVYLGLELEVSKSTTIPLVGLQLWLGAFVLGDFVICQGPSKFRGKTVLELGSGVGLTSLVASFFAKLVIPTDLSIGGILEVMKRNFERNKSLVKSSVDICELDFFEENWSKEISDKIDQADIILAADVIYDNDLSEAFVDTLNRILQRGHKTAYVALEKRYVFTEADLDLCAPCYDYFLDYLRHTWRDIPMKNWQMKPLDLSFPQCFDYERSKHVVLWELSS